MPPKKRDILPDYRAAVFSERQGKGDHAVFSLPLVRKHYVVDGVNGKDAEHCDEKHPREAKRELDEAKRKQGQP